jgi:hypothetical protein
VRNFFSGGGGGELAADAKGKSISVFKAADLEGGLPSYLSSLAAAGRGELLRKGNCLRT